MAERHFVVVEDIPVGGVLAYTRGQTITDADAIERNGWQEYVVAAGTKAAAQVHAEVTGRPIGDFETTSGTTTSRAAAKSSTNQEG